MILETILGGITGLISSGIQSIFTYKTEKLRGEIKLKTIQATTNAAIAKSKADIEITVVRSKADIAITRAKVEGEEELSDANAYVEGQKAASKKLFGNKWIDKLLSIEGFWRVLTVPVATFVALLFGFVDFLSNLMRPALTAYLTGMSTWITIHAWKIMKMESVDVTTIQAVQIFNDTTSIIVYLTVSCVTFWFSDRRMAKTIMQYS